MALLQLPNLQTEGAITLVVGWRSSSKTQLRRVNLGSDVEVALRDVARAVLDDVLTREVEPWTAEADSAPEVVHTLGVDEVGPSPILSRDVAVHGTLLAALASASSLPQLKPNQIPAAELAFYALVIGDDPKDRTIWARRTNPRRGLRRRIFGTLGNDVLERVEAPIFGFEDDLDLVAADGVLAVLSQRAFRALFRDNEDLLAQVPAWIADVAQYLPISADAQKVLEDKCGRDSRLRRRLETVMSRKHLQSVPSPKLRTELRKHGLDPSRVFNAAGELDFKEGDLPTLLNVLNEDLFSGGLTGTAFRSDKKAQA